jgi:hypothetical protein
VHDIRALATKGDLTFAATGSSIVECRRIARYTWHLPLQLVHILLPWREAKLHAAVKTTLPGRIYSNARTWCMLRCRTGTYRAGPGAVVQLLCLGDNLLSLHSTGCLRVWKIGEYDAPEVT